MTDVFTKEQRSRIMRAVKSENTKPERVLFKELARRRLRFRRHYRGAPGSPDAAFPSRRVAVFVEGDFWHARDGVPRKLPAAWRRKLLNNRKRDARNRRRLNRAGWSVLRAWETDILRSPAKAADRVERALARSRIGRQGGALVGADQALR